MGFNITVFVSKYYIFVFLEFTRRELYQIIKKSTERLTGDKLIALEDELIKKTQCPEEKKSEFRRTLRYFKSNFQKKWVASNYMEERFLMNNENWLNNLIQLPTWKTIKASRLVKGFQESSDRGKRRKTQDLRKQVPVEQLTYAVCMSQKAAGNNDVSQIIKDITVSPTRAKKFRASVQKLKPSKSLHHHKL